MIEQPEDFLLRYMRGRGNGRSVVVPPAYRLNVAAQTGAEFFQSWLSLFAQPETVMNAAKEVLAEASPKVVAAQGYSYLRLLCGLDRSDLFLAPFIHLVRAPKMPVLHGFRLAFLALKAHRRGLYDLEAKSPFLKDAQAIAQGVAPVLADLGLKLVAAQPVMVFKALDALGGEALPLGKVAPAALTALYAALPAALEKALPTGRALDPQNPAVRRVSRVAFFVADRPQQFGEAVSQNALRIFKETTVCPA